MVNKQQQLDGTPVLASRSVYKITLKSSLRILGLENDTLPTLKHDPCNRYLSNRKNQTYELRRVRDRFPRQSSKTQT
jgi:hypothetical protein